MVGIPGPLESQYLSVRPGATTGLDACRFFEQHPGRWFTHAELKAALQCSDRILRHYLPAALNGGGRILLEVDKSGVTHRFRFVDLGR